MPCIPAISLADWPFALGMEEEREDVFLPQHHAVSLRVRCCCCVFVAFRMHLERRMHRTNSTEMCGSGASDRARALTSEHVANVAAAWVITAPLSAVEIPSILIHMRWDEIVIDRFICGASSTNVRSCSARPKHFHSDNKYARCCKQQIHTTNNSIRSVTNRYERDAR